MEQVYQSEKFYSVSTVAWWGTVIGLNVKALYTSNLSHQVLQQQLQDLGCLQVRGLENMK